MGHHGLGKLFLRRKDVFLHPLTQTIFRDGGNNFTRMLFFGINPADHLIVVRGSRGFAVRGQFVDLDHRLPDGGRGLLDFTDRRGIILLQK